MVLDISLDNNGLNISNAETIFNLLQESGPAMAVAIFSGILYFVGFAIPCLACGPVRTIVLAMVAFIGNCILIFKNAKDNCDAKFSSSTMKQIVQLALIPTAAFIVGYGFLPWILPGPIRMLTYIGPGKAIIPGIMGGGMMVLSKYISDNYVSSIC